jgi:hypothetical protein
MAAQRTGRQAPSSRSAEPSAFKTPAAEVDWNRRVKTVEARVEHLETVLEGLQDALYRHEVLDEETIGELRRRTDPEQMARDLSDDARRRGL